MIQRTMSAIAPGRRVLSMALLWSRWFSPEMNGKTVQNGNLYLFRQWRRKEYLAALALLQKIGKVPSKHAGVISRFDTEFALKGVFPKEFSRDFHKAFELRRVADYKVIEASLLVLRCINSRYIGARGKFR